MESRFRRILFKFQGISLKWKLLVPFLSLAFFGTVILVYIGLSTQYRLIEAQERKEIRRAHKVFLREIEYRKTQMLSMASVIAQSPEVARMLEARDRKGLLRLLMPMYKRIKRQFGVSLLHLHIPPSKSFLRLHAPESHGEMLAYRKSVVEALRNRKSVTALEWGLTGLAIRGVCPIVVGHRLVGSVEVGYPFGGSFLSSLKENWGPDFTVYGKRGESTYSCLASTSERGGVFLQLIHKMPLGDGPRILIAPKEFPEAAVLIGPIRDYHGEIAAIVEIDIDRFAIEEDFSNTEEMIFVAGSIGIGLSFLLTWLIASMFVRPIREIVKEAEEIAEGVRETRIEERPADEMGHLSRSLNKLLDSLQARQRQIEEYARTLKQRVKERTADLVASEEKYRTLVDNLPLVVYRLQEDGTVEFINPYFTEKLGYTPEEVVGNKEFWRSVICGDHEAGASIIESCWGKREEMRTERKVKSKSGQLFVFIDQAMPMKDEKGNLEWIDGIMLDITELKRLQERALRGEEIRILCEMSARFAHELRNPLATAGGFARRLMYKLPEGGELRKIAGIIVEEVSRLENILRIMLSSIEPVQLSIGRVNVQKLLDGCKRDLEGELKRRSIQLELKSPEQLPDIQGDEDLLLRALESIIGHAIAMTPSGETIGLIMTKEDGSLVMSIRFRAQGLDQEDIDQFFLPRQVEALEKVALDLPLAKVIIHCHGGAVEVAGDKGGEFVRLRIELPIGEA